MKTQITQDRYQRQLSQDYNEQDLTFEDLCKVVRTPTVSETKNNASCVYPFELRYTDGATTAVQDNAHSLTILVMDVDSGYSIDQFIETFAEYQFVLYSTYSHTAEKNRFKAFFPLKQPLELKILRSKYFKSWFQKKYPFNDESILKFVGIYLPNCPSHDTYRYHINEGRQYHFDDFKDEILKSKSKYEMIDKFKEARRKSKEDEFAGRATKASVRNNRKIRDYLDSPVSPTGYGVMAFTAIAVCVTANDMETLELVKDKMSLDSFTQDEIYRMVDNARR